MRLRRYASWLIVASALSAAPAAAQEAGSAEDRSQEFKPVEGGSEVASGEVLLVEAYAAMWLVAFGLVIGSIRRQRRLESRIDALREELRRSGGGAHAGEG